MKAKKSFEIQAHCELNNPGTTLGYWAKGRIDPKEFAIAVNQEYGLADLGRYAPVRAVKYAWYRFVPAIDDDGDRCQAMHRCKEPGRGVFEVTEIDWADCPFN